MQQRQGRADLTIRAWEAINAHEPPKIKKNVFIRSLIERKVVSNKNDAEALIAEIVADDMIVVNENTHKYEVNFPEHSIADIEHDLYCFECHTPKNVQQCSSCARAIHEECYRNITVTSHDESRRNSVRRRSSTAGHIEDIEESKPRLARRPSSFYERISFNENKDVICVGQVRPPNRIRSAPRPHCVEAFELNVESRDNAITENFKLYCSSCQLRRSLEHEDPPLKPEYLNYLLKFAFTRNKTWILTNTYPPLSTSPPMNKTQFNNLQRLFLKFPVRLANISDKLKTCQYKKTSDLLCDVMDIKHSIGVFYGTYSTEYDAVSRLQNAIEIEIRELRICFDCFRHSNEKSNTYWFTKPCYRRHELVYAKIKGYDYWPAKVIQVDGDYYDVRFFGGSHKRAKVSSNKVLPVDDTDIDSLKIKKTAAFKHAMDELRIYQELCKFPPGSFAFGSENLLDLSNTLYSIHLKKLTERGKKRSGRNISPMSCVEPPFATVIHSTELASQVLVKRFRPATTVATSCSIADFLTNIRTTPVSPQRTPSHRRIRRILSTTSTAAPTVLDKSPTHSVLTEVTRRLRRTPRRLSTASSSNPSSFPISRQFRIQSTSKNKHVEHEKCHNCEYAAKQISKLIEENKKLNTKFKKLVNDNKKVKKLLEQQTVNIGKIARKKPRLK